MLRDTKKRGREEKVQGGVAPNLAGTGLAELGFRQTSAALGPLDTLWRRTRVPATAGPHRARARPAPNPVVRLAASHCAGGANIRPNPSSACPRFGMRPRVIMSAKASCGEARFCGPGPAGPSSALPPRKLNNRPRCDFRCRWRHCSSKPEPPLDFERELPHNWPPNCTSRQRSASLGLDTP